MRRRLGVRAALGLRQLQGAVLDLVRRRGALDGEVARPQRLQLAELHLHPNKEPLEAPAVGLFL